MFKSSVVLAAAEWEGQGLHHTQACGPWHSLCSTSEGRRGGSSHLCCFPERRGGFGHQSGSHQVSQIGKYPCKTRAEITARPRTHTARSHRREGNTGAPPSPVQGLWGCICHVRQQGHGFGGGTSPWQGDSVTGGLPSGSHPISNTHSLNKDVLTGASRRKSHHTSAAVVNSHSTGDKTI